MGPSFPELRPAHWVARVAAAVGSTVDAIVSNAVEILTR